MNISKHCLKKVSRLLLDNNFGKRGPTFNILSPVDAYGNSLSHKGIHLNCAATLPCDIR